VTISVLTPATCTLSAGTLTLTSVGACTLAADQAGNAVYEAAPQATATVGVRCPFSFVGLAAPPTLNDAHAGAAITVTFSLGGNRGLPNYTYTWKSDRALGDRGCVQFSMALRDGSIDTLEFQLR